MFGARKSTHSAVISLGSALHADTISWQSRVVAAGGSISSNIVTATDTLVKWAYANGLRDNANTNHLIRFWLPLCTETFSGLFIPIWHPILNAVCTNNSFVTADYTRQTGLQGSKPSTKYISSGVTTTHLGTNSSSIYLAVDSNTDLAEDATEIGCAADSTFSPAWISSIWCKFSDNNGYIEHPGTNSASGATGSSQGFIYGMRNGNNAYFYKNTTLIATGSASPTEIIAAGVEYFLFASKNAQGGAINLSNKRLQGFLIGAGGITQAQTTSFATQYLTWKAIARA